MSLVVFIKTAAGPSFGPYQVGDVADLSSQTIVHLGDAVVPSPDPTNSPTQPAGTA